MPCPEATTDSTPDSIATVIEYTYLKQAEAAWLPNWEHRHALIYVQKGRVRMCYTKLDRTQELRTITDLTQVPAHVPVIHITSLALRKIEKRSPPMRNPV